MSDNWQAKKEIFVIRGFTRLGLGIHIMTRHRNGKTTILVPTGVEEVELKEGADLPRPYLHLPHGLDQQLMNELSNQGFVGERESKSAGILEAQKEHLTDMRRLVFEEHESTLNKMSDYFKKGVELKPEDLTKPTN